MLEPTEGIRVQVVGKDLAASTGRWDRERTDPGENVYYSITTLKEGNDALVFGAQSRVPVHAREIKLVKYTILPYLCNHVTFACQNLHLEVPVSGINGVGLVDHAGNAGVLIYDYLTNQFFVGELVVSQVHVGDVAHSAKS